MALLNNDNQKTEDKREFATDEAGMMKDAKAYAKKDASTILKTFQKMGINITSVDNPEVDDKQNIQESLIIKSLIAVKYEQIVNSRTKRPSYEQYFD